MRLSRIAVFGLLSLTACGSGGVGVAHDDLTSTASRSEKEPAVAASALPAVLGPVAVLGIPPGDYPPLGRCRVWFPGVLPGQQPPHCSCFSLMLDVPAGAWVLYRPEDDETIVEVTTYDTSEPSSVATVSWYDAGSGKYLRSGKTVKQKNK